MTSVRPYDGAVPILKRFVVAEDSMLPGLVPGDGLVCTTLRRPRVGSVVVLPSPVGTGAWLVKRVAAIGPGVFDLGSTSWPVADGEMLVMSDNTEANAVDSRIFGAVATTAAMVKVFTVRRGERP